MLWADEVVVIDSFSIDRTAEIATRSARASSRCRSTALANCATAPSRPASSIGSSARFRRALHEEVRDEILTILAGTPPHDVYRVPRRSYMMGRWIKGSGWFPNFRQPQLFRKGSMRYTLEPVHEGYEILNGRPPGTLTNEIWQFPFRNLEEVIKEMNRYSSLGAPKLASKRVSMASALGHGLWSSSSITFQVGLYRRLGRLCHRLRQFRRHALPLRQALRSNAELAAATEPTGQARRSPVRSTSRPSDGVSRFFGTKSLCRAVGNLLDFPIRAG